MFKEILNTDIFRFLIVVEDKKLEKNLWFRLLKIIHGIGIAVIVFYTILITYSMGSIEYALYGIIALALLHLVAKLIIYVVVGKR